MKALIILLLLTVSSLSFGQAIFNKTFLKSNYDYAGAVVERPDGNYMVVGSSRSFANTDYDINIILVDPLGNLIWDKYLGLPGQLEFGYSVIATNDNNYILSGSLSNQSHHAPYTLKFSPNGTKIWEKIYPTVNQQLGYSIGKTFDNNYFFIGNDNAVMGRSKLYKINLQGDTVWTKKASLINSNYSIQTTDSGYALIGSINITPNKRAIALQKMGSTGNILWTRTYGGMMHDYANAICQTSDKNFLIAGIGVTDTLMIHTIPQTFLIRTNEIGDTLWTKRYNLGDPVYLIEIPNKKGFIFSSTESVQQSFPTSTIHYNHITRIDTAGNILWTQRFRGSIYETGNNIYHTSDGGFLFTGCVLGANQMEDINLIKLDSTGKLLLGTNLKEVNKELGVSTFPNPSRTELNIHIDPNTGEKIKQINVYNSLSQAVISLTDLNEIKLNINLKSLPAGIYSYKLLTSSNKIITRKFIVKR